MTGATAATRGALRRALRHADVSRGRAAVAVWWGTAAIGSAVGLAAVAAWLIARAAGMPSPADLAIAAVVVRFFGIGRGLFRYLERLSSHDIALRGVVTLRVRVYERLAAGHPSRVLTLSRGQVLARLGADIDAVGDAVVRGLLPCAVAVTVSGIAIAISAALVPAAGAALAACLLVAGLGAAALTLRSARAAAGMGVEADARIAERALAAIESAPEHRVWGTQDGSLAGLAEAEVEGRAAHEAAARPAALASAVQTLAAGAALIASIAIAVTQANAGLIGPTTAAVVALLPLAAFEAVGAIPAAVMQLARSSAAAARIDELAPTKATGTPEAATASAPTQARPVTLEARDLSAAWPAMTPTTPVSFTVAPGEVVAVVGASGIGKTTLLATLAGVLAPHAGEALLDGRPASVEDLGPSVAVTSEDAHLFGTSVIENLRVARGDVDEDEAARALAAVGLSSWLDALPDGLDTLVGSGGGTVSGGERRRLLLARASLAPQPVQLIDEPGEHLDAAGREALRAVLDGMRQRGRSVVIVTHDLSLLDAADRTVSLDA
ncbi:thiol reductant ABC exporter subunit CydC [Demequina sp. NBRC 110056]|uniref:thiol reductant ABC exporter subunit CydC n=1 Tax=Demequina sp. NBRC 110056 TaxID=1570345 RepID=UPI000A036AF7|nr:thiol reductant ABC exporter subunit CydC [Demequina sp. NBRC 110056]